MQASTEAEDDRLRQKYLNHWHETWRGFTTALVSTEDFHAFRWTVKLLKAGLCFAYFKSGIYKLKVHIYWRSWVPSLAIALVALVVSSYFGALREIVKERWCCSILGGDNSNCSLVEGEGCQWMLFHDTVVLYLGIMILFNFVSACFRSPGVVLANHEKVKDRGGENPMVAEKSKKLSSEVLNEQMRWSSRDSQGGFCGMDPILNIAREEFLVRNYYNLADLSRTFTERGSNGNDDSKELQEFPSTRETFCDKCMIKRPPRAHHCSISGRCVLQFDHHCVWLNNCVGYNNYRAFLLTLFYLNLGCWYGITMLYRPFLEELNRSGNGWNFSHDNKLTFLELPSASTILSGILNGTVKNEIIIKLVFPFLFAIGLLQAVFFGYHILYVVSALTTLEYKILLDMQFDQLVKNPSSRRLTPPNPFSRGWSQNLKDAFGPIPLVFLPIQVEPKEIIPASDTNALKDK